MLACRRRALETVEKMIRARMTVTVTAGSHSFQVSLDGETICVVPRTTTREIHRYKAYANGGSTR